MQRQRTQGPQSMAWSFFAGAVAFTFVAGFGAGDETVLATTGRDNSAALHVIIFFGWQTFPNTLGPATVSATTKVRVITRELRIAPSLGRQPFWLPFCDMDHITNIAFWNTL